MKTYCNPLDLSYRYKFTKIEPVANRKFEIYREGADPTLVCFKGIYYLFVSMSAGFWYSKDLINWEFHKNENLLIKNYAPDARQIGDYLIFSASSNQANCPFLRSKNPLEDDFEEVSCTMMFWDPDIFQDEDGRVYFYWGCSPDHPIYGCEMDPQTLEAITEPVSLIWGNESELGYERILDECSRKGMPPYIEGAFLSKHEGKYYLQYAAPGTEFATYADGVYVADAPLGPYRRQESNPVSSKPGGFCNGAGHGSTIQDVYGNWWHVATMRISVNGMFERRIGLFPAGFDKDGVMFCNQNFADYPMMIPQGRFDPWSMEPKWMLLSYHKPVKVSSAAPNSDPRLAVDEDIRTWWSAATEKAGEWICVDLEECKKIHGIQVNVADVDLNDLAEPERFDWTVEPWHLEMNSPVSCYKIEISKNGADWIEIEHVSRDCSNGYYEYVDGIEARYVRVTAESLPYNQPFSVSGLRVFGVGTGAKPAKVTQVKAVRQGDMDALVAWDKMPDVQGYNVRYGIAPDKLYMSWMVYGENHLDLTTLIKGQEYYVAVDSFNENGVTYGDVVRIEE